MGCDIHAHVEIKIDGKWYYYDELGIDRNYGLFAKMANVRNSGNIEPISEPKGLPENVTFMTKFKSDYWGSDGHDHSWLSSKETYELEKWIEKEKILPDLKTIGYLFGNSFSGWINYPDDSDRLRERGMQDFRLVFWFDN